MSLKNYQKHIQEGMNYLCVDVGGRKGTGGTGIALFRSTQPKPLLTQLFECSLNDFEVRCNALAFTMKHFLIQNIKKDFISATFIEQPEYFDTDKGNVAATSGSLRKLCYLYGRIFQLFFERGFNPQPLRIIDWKGQLKKQQVEKRIEIQIGKDYVFYDDRDDAIGMGLYLQGRF